MPRAIWTGAISFGLVTVPVKLYTAVQSKSVKFNQLDAEDHSRIKMKRVNGNGDEVPYERIVKGFEIGPDRYVVIEPHELEAIDPKKTKTIDIEGFVDLVDIDPLYFDHPYYLVPGTGGAKPYKLLLDAMRETGKAAIAKVVIRTKENLVVLRPVGDALGMTTMNFHDEVIHPESLDELPDGIETTDRELAIAKQLVESLAEPFEPEKYHDTYREQVLEMIERKAAGEEIAVVAEAEEAEPVPDLMAALKASLDAVRDKDAPKDEAQDDEAAAPKKKTTAAKKKPAAAPKKKAAAKS